jgi:hypothetical protein
MALGVLVALTAGGLLTGVGASPSATAARGATGSPWGGPPHSRPVVSNECRLHARVTVDRSSAVMVALRICMRP